MTKVNISPSAFFLIIRLIVGFPLALRSVFSSSKVLIAFPTSLILIWIPVALVLKTIFSISERVFNLPIVRTINSPFTVFKIYSDKVQVVDAELVNFSQPELFERISKQTTKLFSFLILNN